MYMFLNVLVNLLNTFLSPTNHYYDDLFTQSELFVYCNSWQLVISMHPVRVSVSDSLVGGLGGGGGGF